MTHYENLVVEVRDGVLWLRIHRPKSRNALSRATLSELADSCAVHSAEQTLKAAVLIGTGSEAFAAGGDLNELSAIRSVEEARELFDLGSAAVDGIRNFPVPVVAALNGVALGGGAELAVACDFRIAAEHARIGYIQASLNISCGFGGGTDVMRLLGSSRALLHGLTAKPVDAREALRLGLIDEVTARGESLDDCVARFLEPILKRAPHVIRAYKAIAVAERLALPFAERRRIEREWFATTWTHPDHWSAVERWEERTRVKKP